MTTMEMLKRQPRNISVSYDKRMERARRKRSKQ